jgi:hypothetical protein
MQLTIHCQNDDNPILPVKNVVLPDLSFDPSVRARPTLPNEQRLFWMPIAQAIVIVPIGSDKLVIQHFDLKEHLEKSGKNYFFVESIPPRLFQRGQTLRYAIKATSKQGHVQYTLEGGPSGASVSTDGLVSWKVPADYAPHDAVLAVRLRDGSGEELSHTIKLSDGQRPLEPQPRAPFQAAPRRAVPRSAAWPGA